MTQIQPVEATPKPVLLTTEQAAELLRKKPQTLRLWRTEKTKGPPWINVGGSVLYDQRDVLEFLEAHKTRPGKVTV